MSFNCYLLNNLGPIILKHVEGCILEIGAGVSTEALHTLALQFNRKFYCCDPRKELEALIERYNLTDLYIPFFGTSDDFAKNFNEKIAFAFIDGNHNYDFVKRDFFFVYNLLNPGGIVLMHDMLPPSERYLDHGHCSDAYKLRLELEKRQDIEIITWPYPDPYGISMVMKKLRKWLPPGEEVLE
jgi:predicted O-methyltransferase YrrM